MTTRSRHLLAAAIALVVTLVLSRTGLLAAAWQRLSTPLDPWQRGLAGQAAPAGDEPAQQLVAAQEQVVQLNAENITLRTRLAEYAQVRGEGGIPPEQAVVVRARIIARNQRQGRRYCELDAGAVDGVTKGMAVCAGWSLVGLVAGVQEGRCLVQEITDNESRIPAALIDGQRLLAEGLLTGVGKRGELLLDFVEDRDGLSVVPGLQVVTANSDTRVPPGLVLGTVKAAVRSTTADHWHIEVAPLRLIEACESVLIIRFATAEPAR